MCICYLEIFWAKIKPKLLWCRGYHNALICSGDRIYGKRCMGRGFNPHQEYNYAFFFSFWRLSITFDVSWDGVAVQSMNAGYEEVTRFVSRGMWKFGDWLSRECGGCVSPPQPPPRHTNHYLLWDTDPRAAWISTNWVIPCIPWAGEKCLGHRILDPADMYPAAYMPVSRPSARLQDKIHIGRKTADSWEEGIPAIIHSR